MRFREVRVVEIWPGDCALVRRWEGVQTEYGWHLVGREML